MPTQITHIQYLLVSLHSFLDERLTAPTMDDFSFATLEVFRVLHRVDLYRANDTKIYQTIHDAAVLFHPMNMARYLHVKHNLILE